MIFDRIDQHAKLVNTMADKLGIDLVQETLDGHLQPEKMRGRVFSCMSCSDPAACQKIMDAAPEGLETPPSFCSNGAEFRGLLNR